MLNGNSKDRRDRALDLAVPVAGACLGAALAPAGMTVIATLLAGTSAAALRLIVRPASAENAPAPGPKVPDEKGNRSLLDEIPVPLLIIDGNGVVSFTTRETERLLGRSVSGSHISSVFRAPSVVSAVEEAISGGHEDTFDFRVRRPRNMTLTATVRPLQRTEGGTVIIMTLRDSTGQYRIDETRSDFVANASHELRTPLAAIAGLVETLRGPARNDPEAQDRFLDIIAKQTRRMTRLVNDLLSLSRIELEENVAPTQPQDLREIVSDALVAMRPLSEEHEVALEASVPASLSPVPGSRDELTQVIVNLVDNAVRYGGKRVMVSVVERGDSVRIEVSDNGPGIPSHQIPRLTERFFRADPGDSRAKGGTGLGLAIVKHIVNRHRGTLEVESEPGEGACFSVSLPATKPKDPAPATVTKPL